MNRRLHDILTILFKFIPIDQKTALFSSFKDLYCDNPRYISEALHARDETIQIYWIVSDRTNQSDVPQYVRKVRRHSIQSVIYQNRAKVIIDNFVGHYYRIGSKWQTARFALFKKKGQVNYSTWHGTPLKKVGKDIEGGENAAFVTTSAALIVNSEYEANRLKQAFDPALPMLFLGSARNDPLFLQDRAYINALKNKLGIPLNKRAVLYAPTFRHGLDGGQAATVILSDDDIKKCLDALHERFGDEWCYVYRAHQKISITEHTKDAIIDGNKGFEMAEYLLACDVLITDYSGSLFDFTITEKPCFLYMPDLEAYIAERGVYLQPDDLPYPYAKSVDSMVKTILEYDAAEAVQRIRSFNQRIGLIDDGQASDRIAELILREMQG